MDTSACNIGHRLLGYRSLWVSVYSLAASDWGALALTSVLAGVRELHAPAFWADLFGIESLYSPSSFAIFIYPVLDSCASMHLEGTWVKDTLACTRHKACIPPALRLQTLMPVRKSVYV